MDPMVHYLEVLKRKEADEGHNPGALGIAGWKKCKRKTLVDLYTSGKLTVTQAIRFGLTDKDHLLMLGMCASNEERGRRVKELLAAGVDFTKLRPSRGFRR